MSSQVIGIIGPGRLGTALAAALRQASVPVLGPLGRHQALAEPTLGEALAVILCVPDREIASAASRIPQGPMLAHCSGAATLAPLGGREGFGIHPLLSVTRETSSFAGAGCAVQASSEASRRVALAIAEVLGMVPFQVRDEVRPLYHAAASVAANYVMAVEALAAELIQRCGVDHSLLLPLIRSATDNWARSGNAALTGPIARGDEETVARQRDAVRAHAPEALESWEALTRMTRALNAGQA